MHLNANSECRVQRVDVELFSLVHNAVFNVVELWGFGKVLFISCEPLHVNQIQMFGFL